MPELPEVERAAKLLRETVQGGKIESIDTLEDTIVYDGVTHDEFANELIGRTIKSVHRHGKVFWLELDGEGRHPIFHFGMTGMIQIKGQEPTWYREKPKDTDSWPPPYMKFIMHVRHRSSDEPIQFAFRDARRLARIRLRQSPREEKPINELGFDPLLSMPSLEEFTETVTARGLPVKALLLDQGFSSGVGNWVADEILYHSRVHPEQRSNTLSDEQLQQLHHFTQWVCQTAVDANADATNFPENWLFKHRWGKGKKAKHTLKLPSGEPATIKFITVGGRTSAYVEELQHMPAGGRVKTTGKRKSTDGAEVDGEDDEDAEVETSPKKKRKKESPVWVIFFHLYSVTLQATAVNEAVGESSTAQPEETLVTGVEVGEDEKPTKRTIKKRKVSAPKAKVEDDEEKASGRRRSTRLSRG